MVREIKKDLNRAYYQEEVFWKQKSRNQWLQAGDRNTKHFHVCAKKRKAINRILSVKDNHGVEKLGEEMISETAVEYFQRVYESASPSLWDSFFENFTSPVTEDMNSQLTREVTTKEIRKAAMNINGDKAPGPDGMTGHFYHQFWSTIGEAIISEVREFFNTGVMPSQLNHTNICLLPKIDKPEKMCDYRPISLCNASYKIISKILTSRLKPVLPEIISPEQTEFVPGRQITDNVLVAHELLHSLNHRRRQSKSYMAIKTDISKAYDRVE
ncbi:hypothetical protein V5N11_003633 [Cardamine amara subsp. amara]|uniref:Reverse transcriptase domain-containing protein n=1 Tax=Cardamine amara subsp. amara TaxID=228776 RepID=A0ABD1A7J9_CARAN